MKIYWIITVTRRGGTVYLSGFTEHGARYSFSRRKAIRHISPYTASKTLEKARAWGLPDSEMVKIEVA